MTLDNTKARIAQRAGWINSLFLALLISTCLIFAGRLITTVALARRNIALSILRGSFVDRIGTFYKELADRARKEGWSSYWLGIEGPGGLIVGQGNQLDPDSPYKSFRVTLLRDKTGSPWFEISARTEVLGLPDDQAKAFQISVDRQLTASRRATISDVLRQVERYAAPTSERVNIIGFSMSFSFLPIFMILIALTLNWQLRLLINDEDQLAVASHIGREEVVQTTRAHLGSDDLAGLAIDPFTRRAFYILLCGYSLVALLTGWEPNLYFSRGLPTLAPSENLRGILWEGIALLLVVRILNRNVNIHRDVGLDEQTETKPPTASAGENALEAKESEETQQGV